VAVFIVYWNQWFNLCKSTTVLDGSQGVSSEPQRFESAHLRNPSDSPGQPLGDRVSLAT